MNTDVRNWTNDTIKALDDQFDKLNIQHFPRSPSAHASRESIRHFLLQKRGFISNIKISFPKHMVYVHHGVGKGVPAALAGTSATGRQPKDWFNSVIEPGVEQLADIVAENCGNAVIRNLKIR